MSKYYIVEYNYRDKRGHLLTRREMRGTFELADKIYSELIAKTGNKEPKAPIEIPRFISVVDDLEIEVNYEEEKIKMSRKK